MTRPVPDPLFEVCKADLAEQMEIKQQHILNGLVSIRTEAEGAMTIADAVKIAVSETARLYESSFENIVEAKGEHKWDTRTPFIGAADKFLEYCNSDTDPNEE
jgi:hypothetical protein